MKIYKITEASKYLGISINSLKTLANNGKLNSFKTSGEHRRFREDDLDAYMGVKKEKQERLTVIYARCSTAKQKENLERQKDRLRKHAEEKGYKYLMIDEIASGINEKRKGIHNFVKQQKKEKKVYCLCPACETFVNAPRRNLLKKVKILGKE